MTFSVLLVVGLVLLGACVCVAGFESHIRSGSKSLMKTGGVILVLAIIAAIALL